MIKCLNRIEPIRRAIFDGLSAPEDLPPGRLGPSGPGLSPGRGPGGSSLSSGQGPGGSIRSDLGDPSGPDPVSAL